MDQVGNGGSGTAISRLATLPGAQLQAALASIDVHDLGGSDIALVIQARARLLAWVQAEAAVDITEFVHCPASTTVPTARVEQVQQFACDELALLLHVAPMTGKHVVLDAVDLVERHPRLWAALADGLIDLRKVKAVTALCPDTDDALAAALDDALLSTATRADGSSPLGDTITDTPRALGLRAQRLLAALDPSWTRTVRRETLGRRRLVKGTYGPAGIGYLGLYDIDATGMAAAYEHVNALARGIHRLGDTRTLDQIRADTALDLLTGGTSPIYQAKPPTKKTRTTPAAADTTKNTRRSDEADEAADTVKAEERAADEETTDDQAGATSSASTEQTAAANDEERPDKTPAGDVDMNVGTGSAGRKAGADHAGATAQDTETDITVPSPYPTRRARADVDLIVPLDTLADLVDAMRRGVLTDVNGIGLIPADVAARLVKAAAARPSTWCMTIVDDTGRAVDHVRTHHDPTNTMRDFVNARDRHCRFPGCVVTAVRCDQDHTKQWETGGATCPCNLTPLCRRHHRLKQARGFALTVDPTTNTATWTTPHTGHTTSPPWRYGPPHDLPPPF